MYHRRTLRRRGYGPAVAIAAIIALIAILVPSKAQKVVSSATGNNAGNEVGLNDNGAAGAAAGPAAGTSGAAGTQGQAGTAGKTVTLPGKTTACNGQALQVPGDPYSAPCILFSGDNGGATWKGVTRDTINVVIPNYDNTVNPGVEKLYEAFFTRSLDISDVAVLDRIVGEAGGDLTRFAADRQTGFAREAVLADYEAAASEHGVRAIPTVIVPETGRALVGLAEPAVYRSAFEEAAG